MYEKNFVTISRNAVRPSAHGISSFCEGLKLSLFSCCTEQMIYSGNYYEELDLKVYRYVFF